MDRGAGQVEQKPGVDGSRAEVAAIRKGTGLGISSEKPSDLGGGKEGIEAKSRFRTRPPPRSPAFGENRRGPTTGGIARSHKGLRSRRSNAAREERSHVDWRRQSRRSSQAPARPPGSRQRRQSSRAKYRCPIARPIPAADRRSVSERNGVRQSARPGARPAPWCWSCPGQWRGQRRSFTTTVMKSLRARPSRCPLTSARTFRKGTLAIRLA